MVLPTVSQNGSIPLGNLMYYYIKNNRDIKDIALLYDKQKIISIVVSTMVLDNVVEGLILPKKITDYNLG